VLLTNEPPKPIAEVLAPLHTVWLLTELTFGVGLTVIVNGTGVPVQVVPKVVLEGVTVIVAITGELPVFIAGKEAILPLPLETRPMDVVLFTQVKTSPEGVPPKVMALVEAVLQTASFVTVLTTGIGLTVNVIELLLETDGEEQILLPVMVQLTKSLLFNVFIEYVLEFVPTGIVFLYHW
jgi:hypothetical protein